MTQKRINTRSILFLIGIPLLFLGLSLMQSGNTDKESIATNFNPQVQELPDEYALKFLKEENVDSSFVSFVVEKYAVRELIILRRKKILKPGELSEHKGFKVELYLDGEQKNNSPVLYNSPIEAAIYRFNKNEYEVYRQSLPLVNLHKISVEQKIINKKITPWRDTINTPFKSIDYGNKIPETTFNGEKRVPNIYKPLFTSMLSKIDITFLPYTYVKEGDTLFDISPAKSEYFSSEKITVVSVKRVNDFWVNLVKNNNKALDLISVKGENKEDAERLLKDLIGGALIFSDVFDLEKLANFYAVNTLFAGNCQSSLQFIYNKKNKQLEPFFENFNCQRIHEDFVEKSPIENHEFIAAFSRASSQLVSMNLQDEFIEGDKKLLQKISLINQYYPEKLFDVDLLEVNKRVIRKSLDPSTSAIAEILEMDKNRLTLTIHNVSNYPLEIVGLNYGKKKKILTLDTPKTINSGKKDTLAFDLPRSFENLFVTKKKKETGFVFHKHVFDIFLSYNINGLANIQYATIIPFQPKEQVKEDLFRKEIDYNNHDFLQINEKEKIITFNKDSVILSSPLVVAKGYRFVLAPGTNIDIVNGGKIISHSPLYFNGTKTKPITIGSSDKKGQGVIVFSDQIESKLKHVHFDHLTNPKHGNWSVTGAVTFYESSVQLDNVSIKNNRCEDALNIVRTNFIMKNCVISGTQSDAFDGDFVNGTVLDSQFKNLGNDAIDVSGSTIFIKNVVISNAGDKGLSAGEDSKMIVNNVEILDSEIAVAGKDLSIVNVNKLNIANTKLGFTAFQKKPEFGPSNITVKGINMEGIETKYLIESSSSLIVDGEKIETSQNVKDRMYGVEFGVSSDETRNSQ